MDSAAIKRSDDNKDKDHRFLWRFITAKVVWHQDRINFTFADV